MDVVVNGIVLSAKPYKEKDVLINLFTAELGKITAVIKGVKGPKAKLKYASQPFCFGEWVLSKTGEFYTVTSVSNENSFYELTTDYNKFVIASSMLEMCECYLKPNLFAEKLFINLLKALEILTYEQTNSYMTLCKFMLCFIAELGSELNFEKCGNCNSIIDMSDIFLSLSQNSFVCGACASAIDIMVKPQQFSTLKLISFTSFDKLKNIKCSESVCIDCTFVLKLDVESILNYKIKSLLKLVIE